MDTEAVRVGVLADLARRLAVLPESDVAELLWAAYRLERDLLSYLPKVVKRHGPTAISWIENGHCLCGSRVPTEVLQLLRRRRYWLCTSCGRILIPSDNVDTGIRTHRSHANPEE